MTINPEPVRARVGPLGFHVRGGEFLEIADLARVRNDRFSPVAAFLYCRAVELTFKAYLLARGDTLEHVAALRHDLVALLTEVHARGFDEVMKLTPNEIEMLRAADGEYRGHTLAYPDLFTMLTGFPGVPDLDALGDLTRRIHKSVERGCYEAMHGSWSPWANPTT